MANKKTKKKNLKKEDDKEKNKKKKGLKKKDSGKKEESKKKADKKKRLKKKIILRKKKEKIKKENLERSGKKVLPVKEKVPGASKSKSSDQVSAALQLDDHSSNYNVRDAITILRKLSSAEDVLSFTKGEKRLTITKVIPGVTNRLQK